MATLVDVEYIGESIEKKILRAAQKFTDEYPPIKTLKDVNLMRETLSELIAKMRVDAETI